MNLRLLACALVAAVLPSFSVAADRVAAFSAELEMTRGRQAMTGTFRFHDGNYRLDLTENGQAVVVLYDGQSGLTRILIPAEKSYAEAPAGEPLSMLANPFSAYTHLSRTKTVRTEGSEPIAGVSCEKRVVTSGEQVWVIGWLAEGFDVPLKVEIPFYEIKVALKAIERRAQDASAFVVPAGYALKAEEPARESQPPWFGQVAGAPLVAAPFDQTVGHEEVVRIRTQANRWVRVAATNLRQDQGSFTVLPLKGGKSLGTSEMSTTLIDTGDTGAVSTGAQPPKVDELAIRIGSGPLKIRIEYVPAPRSQSVSPPAPEPPSSESTPAVTAEVKGPETVTIAARFEVTWQGPGANDDAITLARPDQPAGASLSRARVREGNPLKLWAPSEPGSYELRYLNGRPPKILATAPLTVNTVTTKVDSLPSAPVASRIEVDWEGPAAEGDYIAVALPRQPPSQSAARALVKSGNPTTLWLPADPGEYEIRYVLGRGAKLLAKAPLQITDLAATVTPPASAKAGSDVQIRWEGPGYPEDSVTIAPTGHPAGASVSAAKLRTPGALTLRAPREPGTYEVRYVLGRGPRVLARASLTVEPP